MVGIRQSVAASSPGKSLRATGARGRTSGEARRHEGEGGDGNLSPPSPCPRGPGSAVGRVQGSRSYSHHRVDVGRAQNLSQAVEPLLLALVVDAWPEWVRCAVFDYLSTGCVMGTGASSDRADLPRRGSVWSHIRARPSYGRASFNPNTVPDGKRACRYGPVRERPQPMGAEAGRTRGRASA